MSVAPRVFLSYSHDSPEHRERVLALAERLRADGIDATVDQYLEPAGPPEGWPRWMEQQLRTADFVLAICSETYRARIEGADAHGVVWEGKLIYQLIYGAASENRKFVPVLLGESTESDIPLPLADVPNFRPETGEGYEALYRRVTGQPRVAKGTLGSLRSLPPGKVAIPALRSGGPRRRARWMAPLLVIAAAVFLGVWMWNRMPAEYQVQVSVVDPDGRLVNNAKITTPVEGVLRSDAGRTLRIPLSAAPDGSVMIAAEVPGSPLSGQQEVRLGRSTKVAATIRLTARTDARVSGSVLDPGGRAVEGARVSIDGRPDFVLTNTGGHFELPAHTGEGQQVRLRIEKDGYRPLVQDHVVGRSAADVIIER